MKDDHVHSPEETDKSAVFCTKSTSEMSRTQDTHSQRDKIETGITLFDKDIAIKPDNSHAQILKEICTILTVHRFELEPTGEYKEMKTTEEFAEEIIKLTEAATLKEIDSRLRLIDFKRLLTKKDYEILDGVFKVLEDYQKELGASS